MAVNERLRCSAGCGAPEFDAMIERRGEKLVIIDKTLGADGFPLNKEVDAICSNTRCRADLEIRMMPVAIGRQARATVGAEDGRNVRSQPGIQLEFGQIARHVGRRVVLHNCAGGGGASDETIRATIQGAVLAPQDGPDGPKFVEAGGIAVRDDGSALPFTMGCTHGTSKQRPKGARDN